MLAVSVDGSIAATTTTTVFGPVPAGKNLIISHTYVNGGVSAGNLQRGGVVVGDMGNNNSVYGQLKGFVFLTGENVDVENTTGSPFDFSLCGELVDNT